MQTRKNPKTGEEEAYIASARKESMSREVFRHEEFKGKIELGRIRDWFICALIFFSGLLYVTDINLFFSQCGVGGAVCT